MRLILIYLFATFFISVTSAQSNVTRIKDPSFKAVALTKANIIPAKSLSPSDNTKSKSQYLGMENFIAKRLTSKIFPADLPKAKLGQTKEDYTNDFFKWAKNNMPLIKPEFYNEINEYNKQ